MLKKIKIDNGITHHNKEYVFEKGVTAIVGRNGSGKSLIVEFIRFALFGTAALRGKIDEYPKNLRVELELGIKGKNWRIERFLTKATLFNETGEVVVQGTKAVNEKIISLLGYGLNIFDTGNCSNQDEIQSLGKMKPSERKQALDSTLGLSILDVVIRRLNDAGNVYMGEADGLLSRTTQAPVSPALPEDYQKQEYWKEKIGVIDKLLTEKNKLLGGIKEWETIPAEFTDADAIVKEGELKVKLELLKEKKKTLKVESIDVEVEKGKLKAYEEYQKQKRLYDSLPKESPTHEVDYLELQKQFHSCWGAYRVGTVSCPECKTEFNPKAEKPSEEPVLSLEEIERNLGLHRQWKGKEQHKGMHEPVRAPEPNYFTDSEIDRIAKDIEAVGNIEQIRQDYAAVDGAKKKFDDWKSYQEDERKRNRIAEIEKEDLSIEKYRSKEKECLIYDELDKKYKEEKERYDQALVRGELKKKEAEEHKAAASKLKELKVRIKHTIVPLLASVSTSLAKEMTYGKIEKIDIDEDFNILVDGREIRTFSGSEKAIANLAVRLAFGQILTGKSLSLFIGDEIDESMEEARAEATAECLKRLSKFIGQIILVTHKAVGAEHYVRLV